MENGNAEVPCAFLHGSAVLEFIVSPIKRVISSIQNSTAPAVDEVKQTVTADLEMLEAYRKSGRQEGRV